MKLEQSFEVAAPVERVWQALIDVEHVAPCLPGAAITGRNEDGGFNGTFTIKIGPTRASYAGTLEMQAVDEAARTATMEAQGNDKRGQGGARATISSTLTATEAGGTHVDVLTDYYITGLLARFGRGGMIEDISERLLREFADRLQASLVEPGLDGVGAVEEQPAPADEAVAVAPPEPMAQEPPPIPAPPAPPPEPPPARAPEPAPPPAPQPGQQLQLSEPVEGLSLVGSVLWQRVRTNRALGAVLAALVLAWLLVRRRVH
jgi:uncharacterized protein